MSDELVWGNIESWLSFRAQLRTSEDQQGRHAHLKADGKYELDTVAKGSLKNAAVSFELSFNIFL